jgi:dTDP-4-dehydrorhamnose 3,5-epimerase
MSRFEIEETPLNGLVVLNRIPRGDDRGYLERMFCVTDLASIWHGSSVRQINRSLTKRKGTVRGMHFQHPPHAEKKLITCLRGEVFDVAMDLRIGSPTFLKYHGVILSESNHKSLLIPEGFAHGFQTLTNDCELLYLHSADYAPAVEDGLNALDPLLRIQWPLSITERSRRDEDHTMLVADFQGIKLA